MAVTRKAVGPVAIGTASVIATDFPASAAAGDLAILFCVGGNGAYPAAPAGWDQINKVGVGSGGTDVGAVAAYCYCRTLDGTEGSSVNAPRDNIHTHAVVALFAGHDPANPVTASTGTNQSPASTSASTDSLATKAGDGNDLFLAFYGHDRDSNTASARTGSTFTNLSATVSSLVNDSTTQSGGSGLMVEEGDPSANSTGAVSHSVTITNSIWASMLLRINAAAGGTDGNGAGGVGTVTASSAGGAGSGAGNAVSGIGTVSLSASAGAASGSGNVAGGIATATLSAPSGAGSGSANASAGPGTIAATAPTGTASASANGTASGGIGTASLAAPNGAASGNASAVGGIGTVTLSAPSGVASSAGSGAGSGGIGTVTASPPNGAGSGAAAAGGLVGQTTVLAPDGAGTGSASAAGVLGTATTSAPQGTGGGDALASGGSNVVQLFPPEGAAASFTPVTVPENRTTFADPAMGETEADGAITTTTASSYRPTTYAEKRAA